MYRIETYNYLILFNLDGKSHRTNGPAIIKASGHKTWYYNNKFIKDEYPPTKKER